MFNRKKIKILRVHIEVLEKCNKELWHKIHYELSRENEFLNKAKYDEEKIKGLEKENDKLKSLLPRGKILGMMSYYDLVKLAETDYGIGCQTYEDKADLIDEIIGVETQLKKIGAV